MIDSIQFCVNRYQLNEMQQNATKWIQEVVSNETPFFSEASLQLLGEQPQPKLKILFSVKCNKFYPPAFVAVNISNSMDISIMQAIPTLTPVIIFDNKSKDYIIEIDIWGLIPSIYAISLWIGSHNTVTYDWQKNILQFEIIESPTTGRTFPHNSEHGYIVPHSVIKIL